MKKLVEYGVQFSCYLVMASLCCVMGGVPSYATAKTLPKGVWKLDASMQSYGFVKGGVNPSGDKTTWVDRSVDSFTMRDIPTFVGLAGQGITIDLDTQLAEFWNRHRTVVNVGYGVTDKFTVFGLLTKEKGQLKYTDAYVAQTQILEAFLGAANNVAPSLAKSDRLRDVYVGAKYRVNDSFAVATKISAGFLRIGHDASEVVVADGAEELSTGKGYDEYQLYAFYDTKLGTIPLHATLGYILKGEELHTTLENNFTVKHGNVLVLGLASSCDFSSKLGMNYGLTLLSASADQYKGGNSNTLLPATGHATLTNVPSSAVSALMANVGFTFKPERHIRFYANLDIPVSNQRTGQVYDFPGRIEPGTMVSVGTQVFLK